MPISPNQGSTSGGTLVTITGTNLSNTISVNFGDTSATNVTNVSPTQVTATSPAGTSVVYVSVTTPGGTSNSIPFFYISPPIALGLSPSSGSIAGGDTVTITGYNLSTATSVNFGGNFATPTILNDGTITVVAPAGASTGTVIVSVTTAGGNTAGLQYTYVDSPTITTITPDSGSTSGGTNVTITGTELLSTLNVTFDGNSAAFGIINSTTISAITPIGTAGAVDVVVTTSGGSATAVAAYTYVSEPGI